MMSYMKLTKSFIIQKLFFVLLAVSMAACGSKVSEEATPEEEHTEQESNTVELTQAQVDNAGIELGQVERKQISGIIKVNGMLDVPPQNLVSISAPMGGFLKNTDLLQGLRVRKGQMIAKIENLDFIQLQQDFLEAKSELELAKADYERQQQLANENVNSDKILQQAKTTYTSWQARHSGLTEKLRVLGINAEVVSATKLSSTINLYSPINGYVTQVNVNIGKFVNPTDVLFEIVDTEHLHAELIVFEKDVPKLKIGQKVRFTLANETNERIATVYLIGREINADRTIQIHCHIDKEDKELLPGMYLKAAVETGGTQVPALPDEAILDFEGLKYIFISTDAKHEDQAHKKTEEKAEGKTGHTEDDGIHFEMITIQVGNSEFGYTEVVLPESFNIESKVIVKGAYAVLSKMKNTEEEGGHGH